MILYIVVATLSVLLASRVTVLPQSNIHYVTRGRVMNRVILCGLFTLLFLVSALRIHTGNDYNTYVARFHDISYGIYVVTEKGFNLLVKLLYWFTNTECYLYVFALFAALTVFVFLEGMYKQSSDFAMTFFLFMAFGLYFQSLNTVRYYFALAIILYAHRYVVEKKYISFIVTILIASLFHKSTLVCIPVFLLAIIPWKRWHVIGLTIISSIGLLLRNPVMDILIRLYPSYRYEEEYLAGGALSIVNVARSVGVLALCLLFYKEAIKDDRRNRFYFYLNYAALLIYSFFFYIPFVSRIGYYLNISNILLIPGVITKIKDDRKRRVVTVVIILAGILYFAMFLRKAPGEDIKILPYFSWLFEDYEFIPLEPVIYNNQ